MAEENVTPAGGTSTPATPEVKDGEKGKVVKTFTEAEHQEELNRVAAKTRDEERVKAEKAFDDRIKKEREDWDKKAKMSAEEREAEMQKEKQAEISTKEAELILKENKIFAYEKLTELSLPVTFVDFLINPDKAIVETNITKFQEAYNKAISDGVEAKLAGKTPTDSKKPAGGTTPEGKMYM